MTHTRTNLVTGATGLIGRELVGQLAAGGDEVVVVVRRALEADELPPGVRIHHLDLTTAFGRGDLPHGPFDTIVHLAQHDAYSSFPDGAGEVSALTIGAPCRLAELARELGASRLVIASSGGIYGSAREPISEGAPIRLPERLGFYLGAKAAAEQLLAHFRPGLSVTFVRYFFVYGPKQASRFLIARLVDQIREGAPITLASGCGPRLNPVHVRDAAAATAACLGPAAPDVLNVAGPTTASLHDIATAIGAHVGREPQFEIIDEEPRDLVGDISLMRTLHEPTVDLEAGLAEVCAAR